jgi:hypothetical protein
VATQHSVPTSPLQHVPAIKSAPQSDRAEERGLELDADTNLPLWDGTRPDYDFMGKGAVPRGANEQPPSKKRGSLSRSDIHQRKKSPPLWK